MDGIGNIVGFTTSPHGLKKYEKINVSGLNIIEIVNYLSYFSQIFELLFNS